MTPVSRPSRATAKALRETNRELDVLRRISETISCTLDQEAVLRQIIDLVVEVTSCDAAFLYLVDEGGKELVLRASKQPHPRLIGRIKLEMGEGITGWVARERTPVAIARHASDDPRFKYFQKLPEDRYQAFLSVPVIAKNEVIGVINVQHREPHRHTASEIALLSAIGHQVGGAIENASLYDAMRRKTLQLETLLQVSTTITSTRYLEEMLPLIVTITARTMGSAICSIMLTDEQRGELRIAATQSLSDAYRGKPSLKIGEGVSGRAVRDKRPIAVTDVTEDPAYVYRELARREGLRSLLSVPMLYKDRAVGVINSYTAEPHVFRPDEIELLEAVANQAAVAIENTRLMQETAQMHDALELRKLVEKAKGILMRERRLTEEEAFRVLQRQSMNNRWPMKQVAEAVIGTARGRT
ncbi:MAG TPA: GAF domain-containing protein [Nitrospiria bacterium]|nr:GAF domain-containing protein [Nitrospiria bacterium]